MALDKAIAHGKEKRKPYRGGKAIDPTCRNHGGCPACEMNRKHSTTKRLESMKEKEKEMKNNGITFITALPDNYSPEKKAEGIAINNAVFSGACDKCPYLETCSSDETFVFPNDAQCMKDKERILKKWRGQE